MNNASPGSWSSLVLIIHIIAGFTGLICAPVALATRKGSQTHRRWGKIYFWAMAIVSVSALILALLRPIYFLALVAVFSFYGAFNGYRVLYLKNLPRGQRASTVDWLAAGLTFLASGCLVLAGVLAPRQMVVGLIHIAGYEFSVVSVLFGFLGCFSAGAQVHRFVSPPQDPFFWWYDHLRGMLASYIAALTAFSAVNLAPHFGNVWWVWLWPTLIGSPVIALWTRLYKRKLNQR